MSNCAIWCYLVYASIESSPVTAAEVLEAPHDEGRGDPIQSGLANSRDTFHLDGLVTTCWIVLPHPRPTLWFQQRGLPRYTQDQNYGSYRSMRSMRAVPQGVFLISPYFTILTQTQIPAPPAINAMVKLDQHFGGTRKTWHSWQQVLCKCHKSPAYIETVHQLQAALQPFFVWTGTDKAMLFTPRSKQRSSHCLLQKLQLSILWYPICTSMPKPRTDRTSHLIFPLGLGIKILKKKCSWIDADHIYIYIFTIDKKAIPLRRVVNWFLSLAHSQTNQC